MTSLSYTGISTKSKRFMKILVFTVSTMYILASQIPFKMYENLVQLSLIHAILPLCFTIPTINVSGPITTSSPNLILGSIISSEASSKPVENDDIDPIEASGQFEGDIVLPKIEGRNAIRNEDLKWPGGRVPYTMPLFYGVRGRIMVALAVSEFSRNTCVRFVTRTNETDYLSLFRGGGCYSMVGRMGGKQELSLATGCDQMGIVIHEFMHALGFWHEQSRIDRDEYVTIRWENIAPGTENNFQKYTSYLQQTLDEEYDYSSLLHYSGRAFSKNGRPTVEPKQLVGNFIIGQRFGFSQTDVRKINKLYNCEGYL